MGTISGCGGAECVKGFKAAVSPQSSGSITAYVSILHLHTHSVNNSAHQQAATQLTRSHLLKTVSKADVSVENLTHSSTFFPIMLMVKKIKQKKKPSRMHVHISGDW